MKYNCNSPIQVSQKDEIYNIILTDDLLEQYDKKLEEIMFGRREAGVMHNSYEWGEQLYQAVTEHNAEKMKELLLSPQKGKVGILAKEDIRSAKNLAICAVSAMIHYALRDKFIDAETVYSISDAVIQIIEEADSVSEVWGRLYAGLYKLSEKMKAYGQHHGNPLINSVKNYIYQHLHDEIVIEKMAVELGVNASYLSRVFHKEEGIALKKYIVQERIYRAENMLKYSDFSILEISKYLGFSSQSHFTEKFREHTKMTPAEFRKKQ